MNFLLDTHALLWFFAGDRRLPKAIKDNLELGGSTFYISTASIWEVAIKISLGKIKIENGIRGLLHFIEANSFEILSIKPSHILEIETLPFHHRDPFDRMIIAQARIESLNLISGDSEFKLYDVSVSWGEEL